MARSKSTLTVVPPQSNTQNGVGISAFDPSDIIPIETVASRLHQDVSWVREKIRRRCPNPMPVYNLGRHLVFEWSKVCEWIRQSGRGQAHAKHHRAKRKAA